MKCFRSVLVGVVVVSCFFLTGFKKHISNRDTSTKSQHSAGAAKQQKPLDLTVPLRNVSFDKPPESLAIVEGSALDALSDGRKGKPRVVELHGHLIMSQEPEAGKMKSADGAGIMINLRQ